MDDITAIDAHIDAQSEAHQALLRTVRSTVKDVCPEAVEVISYAMPGFRLRGKLLLSYAGYKRHCAIYPASGVAQAELGADLAPFVTEKATIRFTAANPLPEGVLRRYVEVRVRENAEAAGEG
jgi:uncharacterized protein YdhG (YjbR/CyaY superfamily)